MKKIAFTKMVASGNDFVVIEVKSHKSKVISLANLARKICNRKFGVGADGLLVLTKSKKADLRMRIFNADGSEAQMCGNGARCVALYTSLKHKAESVKLDIETGSGIIDAVVDKDNVKIKLTDPKGLKLDMPLKLGSKNIRVNFINTGVPHTVIFVEGLNNIDVDNLGREIRNHRAFGPKGTNVNFIEALVKNAIAIRTYERGVEAETLACGTGSVASALIFALKSGAINEINAHTQGKEILKVYFDYKEGKFSNVWLEGTARVVFEGKLE